MTEETPTNMIASALKQAMGIGVKIWSAMQSMLLEDGGDGAESGQAC